MDRTLVSASHSFCAFQTGYQDTHTPSRMKIWPPADYPREIFIMLALFATPFTISTKLGSPTMSVSGGDIPGA
jgi:hypothetical protein